MPDSDDQIQAAAQAMRELSPEDRTRANDIARNMPKAPGFYFYFTGSGDARPASIKDHKGNLVAYYIGNPRPSGLAGVDQWGPRIPAWDPTCQDKELLWVKKGARISWTSPDDAPAQDGDFDDADGGLLDDAASLPPTEEERRATIWKTVMVAPDAYSKLCGSLGTKPGTSIAELTAAVHELRDELQLAETESSAEWASVCKALGLDPLDPGMSASYVAAYASELKTLCARACEAADEFKGIRDNLAGQVAKQKVKLGQRVADQRTQQDDLKLAKERDRVDELEKQLRAAQHANCLTGMTGDTTIALLESVKAERDEWKASSITRGTRVAALRETIQELADFSERDDLHKRIHALADEMRKASVNYGDYASYYKPESELHGSCRGKQAAYSEASQRVHDLIWESSPTPTPDRDRAPADDKPEKLSAEDIEAALEAGRAEAAREAPKGEGVKYSLYVSEERRKTIGVLEAQLSEAQDNLAASGLKADDLYESLREYRESHAAANLELNDVYKRLCESRAETKEARHESRELIDTLREAVRALESLNATERGAFEASQRKLREGLFDLSNQLVRYGKSGRWPTVWDAAVEAAQLVRAFAKAEAPRLSNTGNRNSSGPYPFHNLPTSSDSSTTRSALITALLDAIGEDALVHDKAGIIVSRRGLATRFAEALETHLCKAPDQAF